VNILNKQPRTADKGRSSSFGFGEGLKSGMLRNVSQGPLGVPEHRWGNNIKMDLRGGGWDVWAELIWLRIGFIAGLF
jgi:hypothetical protein